MNTIYKLPQNQIPYTAPPDRSRLPFNRRKNKVDEKEKLSFKSYYPPDERNGSVVDVITETILIRVLNAKDLKEIKRRLKAANDNEEKVQELLSEELGHQRRINLLA